MDTAHACRWTGPRNPELCKGVQDDSYDDAFDDAFDDAAWDRVTSDDLNGMLEQNPDHPDPGCQHPWHQLSFLDGDLGLACIGCMRTWLLEDEEDLPDALLSVWQSAKSEFSHIEARTRAMTHMLEEHTGLRSCRTCGTWGPPEGFVTAGDLYVCPEHMGAALARLEDEDDVPVLDAVNQLSAWLNTGTLNDVWLAERNIAAYPPLAEALGRTMGVLREQKIELPGELADRLGVTSEATVGLVTDALAEALELDYPRSRAGLIYLLAMLAEAQGQSPVEVGEVGSSRSYASFPVNPTDRALIVLDLCRSDLPETVEFSGDMADDVVRSIAERASDLLT